MPPGMKHETVLQAKWVKTKSGRERFFSTFFGRKHVIAAQRPFLDDGSSAGYHPDSSNIVCPFFFLGMVLTMQSEEFKTTNENDKN
ncbi:hypothetical protein CEXT_109521 [Caerostris extrusa]|uniref:Uncharacterized protein n=1 Tax=Caerostris extrusa TaxID=172846 RepID=A0AAV4WQJ5_CAEEX|nr:hypothetical protein CEXT_109521 [Caerostris extrusa]